MTTPSPHALTSKIADVLAEVLVRHAHHSAPIAEAAKAQAREAFLEGIESAHVDMVRPILDTVMATGKVPAELRPALEAMGAPTQAWQSLAVSFLVYGVGFSVASTVMQPFLQDTLNDLWLAFPDRPLSPQDLADMVERTVLDDGTASHEAAKSGTNAENFARLVANAGNPPGLSDLADMVRRGVIDTTAWSRGVSQSRIKNEWQDNLLQMLFALPSPADFVAAAVEEQLPHAEAAKWARVAGLAGPTDVPGGIDFFQLLVDTRGRPPGPGQLGDMLHRGIIPADGTGPDALTFQQGIAESDVKTKWTDSLRRLSEYLPPPRTITALLREGALSHDHAEQLFQQAGLPPDLAAVYVASATQQKIAADKELAKGEVVALYKDRAIDTATAIGMLGSLGYHGTAGQFILEIADLQLQRQYLTSAIGKIRSLYVGLKIDKAAATNALTQLQLPADQLDQLLHTWDIEIGAEVKLLTPGEIEAAVYYKVLTFTEGLDYLVALGYTAYDAWVKLSVRLHAPQDNPPPKEPPAQRPEVGL